jgi:hypothetical protein
MHAFVPCPPVLCLLKPIAHVCTLKMTEDKLSAYSASSHLHHFCITLGPPGTQGQDEFRILLFSLATSCSCPSDNNSVRSFSVYCLLYLLGGKVVKYRAGIFWVIHSPPRVWPLITSHCVPQSTPILTNYLCQLVQIT